MQPPAAPPIGAPRRCPLRSEADARGRRRPRGDDRSRVGHRRCPRRQPRRSLRRLAQRRSPAQLPDDRCIVRRRANRPPVPAVPSRCRSPRRRLADGGSRCGGDCGTRQPTPRAAVPVASHEAPPARRPTLPAAIGTRLRKPRIAPRSAPSRRGQRSRRRRRRDRRSGSARVADGRVRPSPTLARRAAERAPAADPGSPAEAHPAERPHATRPRAACSAPLRRCHRACRRSAALARPARRQVTARLELVEDAAAAGCASTSSPPISAGSRSRLRLDDAGTAAATFTVDRPETLQLLQRDARAVNEMLTCRRLHRRPGRPRLHACAIRRPRRQRRAPRPAAARPAGPRARRRAAPRASRRLRPAPRPAWICGSDMSPHPPTRSRPMTISAVAAAERRASVRVVEPEPRRQLRQFPQAADHAAAEPGPAGAHGRQRVHLAAGRVRLGRAGDPDQQPSSSDLGKLIESSGTTSAMGMLGQRGHRRRPTRIGSPPTGRRARSATGCRRPRPRCRSACSTPRPGRAQPGRRHRRRREPVRWDGMDGAGSRVPAGSYHGASRRRARRRHRAQRRAVPHRDRPGDRARRRRHQLVVVGGTTCR